MTAYCIFEAMYTHTKFDHEFIDSPLPSIGYVVCSTPRCGSSLLCETLSRTLLAGVPTEYFDEMTRQDFCRVWKIDKNEHYLPALIRKKTSPNGVFGFKAHFHQYAETFGTESLPNFCPRLKYIWVSRRDPVRQAVSYWRAIQTNQWASTHQCTNDSPQFDFEQIRKLKQQNEFEQREWKKFFDRHAIQPLQLTYEEFFPQPINAAKRCLEFLEIARPGQLPDIVLTLQRQSDELSEQWVRQFHELSKVS